MAEEALKDHVALITGGGSGIGLGIATAFARAGAAVAITGRRADKLDSAVRQLEKNGARALAIPGDISRPEDAERMVAETIDAFGALHVLVNNAGIARYGSLADMSREDLDAVIDVDLKGPLYVTRAALPHLRRHAETAGASVISISSSITQAPVKSFAVYSAAKAGLDMLTRCCAVDFAGDRVRFNAICPGVVETPIFETMMPPKTIDRALAQFAKVIPLGRVGQPGDIARLALFLAGPDSSWLTGAVIPLDGGLSLVGA